MTRAFSDPDVVHVEGCVDPKADIETIFTELIRLICRLWEKAIVHVLKKCVRKKLNL